MINIKSNGQRTTPSLPILGRTHAPRSVTSTTPDAALAVAARNAAFSYPCKLIARTAEGKHLMPYTVAVRSRRPRTQYVEVH